MTYVLDSNTISDVLQSLRVGKKNAMELSYTRVYARLLQQISLGSVLYVCQPILFEVKRGLIYAGATAKLTHLVNLQTNFEILPIIDADWEQAAQLWAQLQRDGRTLSDIDILIAAATIRVGATLVSADEDFAAIPALKMVNWRAPFSL